ncbi:hypothetical protein [Sorangium cellulosum]|uniref:hypothetical protein n=1 Tax=Sorangium cellulosum TaxID=56 RepID=UPI000AAE4940|nr:hypothetical protein [Sorangium cellulosum]
MPTMSRATVLVPSLSSPIVPNLNLIFSPDFPLEEREGKAFAVPRAAGVPWSVARVGAGGEALRDVAQEIARRSGSIPDGALPESAPGDALGAYAFSFVRPSFASPFASQLEDIRFREYVLPAFGLWKDVDDVTWSRAAAQLRTHRHRGVDDFVIEIEAKGDERVLVARCPGRPETLGAGVGEVVAAARRSWGWLRKWFAEKPFDRGCALRIPPLDLCAVRVPDELIGKPLSGGDGRIIGDARHVVRFRLDGDALPPSEPGPIALGRGDAYERPFVCNGPFLVVVLGEPPRDELRLAAWIEAPEPPEGATAGAP